jgi:hypothetical protein
MNLLLVLVLLLGPAPRPEVAAAEILHAWDVRRCAAWSTGDVATLRSLYTRDSGAGRADVAMLHAWRVRGMRVEDLQVQLLSVRVRSWVDDSLVIEVVDRVVGGTVSGTVSGAVAALPTDLTTAHTIAMRRVAGEWRVAAVSGAFS